MGVIGQFIVGVVVVVLLVAVAYDLRARRRRRLAGDFKEAGRRSALDAERHQSTSEARTRPDKMGGPGSGPGIGGPGQ